MILLTGRPPECPDFVSYSSKIGRSDPVFACKIADIFRACKGATRVSPSPVMKSTAGYFFPFSTFCYGEYALRYLNCSGFSGLPYSGTQYGPSMNLWNRSMSSNG